MPTSANSVEILPTLFYRALSGEFNPSGNPLQEPQTLGGIAIETIMEGELTTEPGAEATQVLHTLDWAPTVRTLVTYINEGDEPRRSLTLVELVTDENRLRFGDGRNDKGVGSGVPVKLNESEYYWLPNNQGGDLIKATSRVAEIAQKFFDMVNPVVN